MAIACPVDLNTAVLRAEISNIYGRVATAPDGDFHFHRGPAYAAEFLGYDPAEMECLPSECTASFAGIGNPLAIGILRPGGRLQLADIALDTELSEEISRNIDLWTG